MLGTLSVVVTWMLSGGAEGLPRGLFLDLLVKKESMVASLCFFSLALLERFLVFVVVVVLLVVAVVVAVVVLLCFAS